jgi:hypothetical protein
MKGSRLVRTRTRKQRTAHVSRQPGGTGAQALGADRRAVIAACKAASRQWVDQRPGGVPLLSYGSRPSPAHRAKIAIPSRTCAITSRTCGERVRRHGRNGALKQVLKHDSVRDGRRGAHATRHTRRSSNTRGARTATEAQQAKGSKRRAANEVQRTKRSKQRHGTHLRHHSRAVFSYSARFVL